MSKLRMKSMFIVFFYAKRLIHKDFVPTGQSVIDYFYVLHDLKDRVHHVRPEI